MSSKELARLYQAHGYELQVFLGRQVGCPDTAADLLQETFLRFAQQPQGAGGDNPKSYLYRTARNLVIDHFRKQGRRRTDVTSHEDLDRHSADEPDVEHAYLSRERLDLLFKSIETLKPLTQQIFLLNKVEGKTYGEIAHQLGISESSVQKHLSMALRHAMAAINWP